MNTELERYDPRTTAVAERDVVDGWFHMLPAIADLADRIANTDFVPRALRNKPAAIAACMLTGREIGIGPMLALKVIHMVDGNPTLAAEYKRARALERGHHIAYDETSTVRCTVRGRRQGEDTWTTVKWELEDARRAGLAGKNNWKNHPRRMLEARATGELCDLLFPECTYGLATLEEAEDATDAAGTATVAPARTARRKTGHELEGGITITHLPAGARASSGTAPGPPLPPLPGEEEDVPAEVVPGGGEAAFSTAAEPASAAGSPGPAAADPPSAAGSVTKAQLIKLGAIFTEYGFTAAERDQRLTTAEMITGRELTGPKEGRTSANLSRDEASALIDTLEQIGGRDALTEHLAEFAASRDQEQ